MPELGFHILLGSSFIVDLVVFFGVLYARRGGKRVRLQHVLAALIGTSLVAVPKLIVLRVLGVNPFGWIHVVYLDLAIGLPLAGLVLLWSTRRLRSQGGTADRGVIVCAFVFLAWIPVSVYATFFEPFRLQFETDTGPVSPIRSGSEPLRIGILADIQTSEATDYERDALDRLMDRSPDIILIPGDVFQGSDEAFEAQLQPMRDLLARLHAPGGVHVVSGDVDSQARLERLFDGTNAQLLMNETVTVQAANRQVTVGGVRLDYASPAARRVIRRLQTDPGDGDIRILLAHRPDVVQLLKPGSRIDLVAAGHTHGGQIVIPFFGPPMTLSRVPRDMAAGGLHQFNRNWIYVSRGLGCERGQAPRIRFLCPPEVTLLTLADKREGT